MSFSLWRAPAEATPRKMQGVWGAGSEREKDTAERQGIG